MSGIIDVPRPDRQGPPPAERRTTLRYGCGQGKGLPALVGRESRPALVQDISFTGVSFLLNRRPEIGHTLRIVLGTPGFTCLRVLRVTRSLPTGKGRWLVGGTFANPLSATDLLALLLGPRGQHRPT